MKRYIIFFLLVASAALAFTPWWVLGIPGWLLLANLIHEIAHLVGYADIYQFSRAYRRYFGFPPSKTP